MVNYIGLGALIRRELKRTYMVINQVVWPPIIMTLLFLFIFGLSLGSRIKTLGGVPYVVFLLPGLVMLNVISSSYYESSSSLFQQRFMNSIQELLIAPLSAFEMVLGYIIAGVVRAIFIALLITVLGIVLVHAAPQNWALYLLAVSLVAVLFSALGIVFGLLAEKFDHIAILTTFISALTGYGFARLRGPVADDRVLNRAE